MFYHSAIILGHMKLKGGTIMEKRMIVLVVALLLPLSAFSAQAAVELTYWTHEDPNRTNIENRYISEFEKANPGVVIKRVTNPSKKMAERILTAFAANQGPDIFNLQIEDEYAYIVNQRLAPVDYKAAGYDSVKSIYGAYIPKVLDPVTYEGLPLDLPTWCVYLNGRNLNRPGLTLRVIIPKRGKIWLRYRKRSPYGKAKLSSEEDLISDIHTI